MPRLRILVGDDHRLVREAFRRILEDREGWQVVGEAADGREFVQLAVDLQPDVAVLDVTMPTMTGWDAVKEVAQRAPGVPVLIVTMHGDERSIRRAIQAGAKGYVVKESADADLLDGVAAVAAGQSYFSPAVAKVMLNDYVRRLDVRSQADAFDLLSAREREVFQLVAEGKTNREIAELLLIRPTTVETHRARVLHKLDLHSAAELVLCAVRRGVVA